MIIGAHQLAANAKECVMSAHTTWTDAIEHA
jgi:hypothetical protein